jgi:serine/threonine-protein kinase
MEPVYPKAKDRYPIIYAKDTDAPLPPSALFNPTRYAYFKTIAKGGTCLIQSCKDFYFNRVICYKTLKPEYANDPLSQKRFVREARVTANLQHPNTIPVYELGRNKRGHYYFTMKLVEGVTLREILLDMKAGEKSAFEIYTLDRLIDILIQVANALAYAHKHGVVHRDVKPANILIGPFGEVLVLDWGLAKVWDMKSEDLPSMPEIEDRDASLTAQGSIQATPLYMSPEQVTKSKDIDHRTDIYSLGSVLYEMLTLEHMAWGDTVSDMLEHTLKHEPDAPSSRNPDREIPEELEEICLKSVRKEPGDRQQTMEAFLDLLITWRQNSVEI